MTRQAQKDEELDRLSRLGFGVAGELMTESRVLVDTGFQGPFFRELDEKLGETLASHIRAQIGLFHGLRDGIAALGSMRSEFQQRPPTTYPAVPIQFQSFENHSKILMKIETNQSSNGMCQIGERAAGGVKSQFMNVNL